MMFVCRIFFEESGETSSHIALLTGVRQDISSLAIGAIYHGWSTHPGPPEVKV